MQEYYSSDPVFAPTAHTYSYSPSARVAFTESSSMEYAQRVPLPAPIRIASIPRTFVGMEPCIIVCPSCVRLLSSAALVAHASSLLFHSPHSVNPPPNPTSTQRIEVQTVVGTGPSFRAYSCALLLCLFGGLVTALIPLCMDSCAEVRHICPSCGVVVSRMPLSAVSAS